MRHTWDQFQTPVAKYSAVEKILKTFKNILKTLILPKAWLYLLKFAPNNCKNKLKSKLFLLISSLIADINCVPESSALFFFLNSAEFSREGH